MAIPSSSLFSCHVHGDSFVPRSQVPEVRSLAGGDDTHGALQQQRENDYSGA